LRIQNVPIYVKAQYVLDEQAGFNKYLMFIEWKALCLCSWLLFKVSETLQSRFDFLERLKNIVERYEALIQ